MATIAEKWIKKGKEDGKEEGKKEGKWEMIMNLLRGGNKEEPLIRYLLDKHNTYINL